MGTQLSGEIRGSGTENVGFLRFFFNRRRKNSMVGMQEIAGEKNEKESTRKERKVRRIRTLKTILEISNVYICAKVLVEKCRRIGGINSNT